MTLKYVQNCSLLLGNVPGIFDLPCLATDARAGLICCDCGDSARLRAAFRAMAVLKVLGLAPWPGKSPAVALRDVARLRGSSPRCCA